MNSGAEAGTPTATVALSDTSKEGVEPQVAFSGGTQVTAVWRWKDGSSGVIQTLTSADGGVTLPAISTAKTLSGASEQAYLMRAILMRTATRAVIWYISRQRDRSGVVELGLGVTWSGDTDGSIREQWPKLRLAASTMAPSWSRCGSTMRRTLGTRRDRGRMRRRLRLRLPRRGPGGPQTQSVVRGCVSPGIECPQAARRSSSQRRTIRPTAGRWLA